LKGHGGKRFRAHLLQKAGCGAATGQNFWSRTETGRCAGQTLLLRAWPVSKKREHEATTRSSRRDGTARSLRAAKVPAVSHTAEEQLEVTVADPRETDGLVVSKFVESGEVVNAGQAVFKIARNNRPTTQCFECPESPLGSVLPARAMGSGGLDKTDNVWFRRQSYESFPRSRRLTRT